MNTLKDKTRFLCAVIALCLVNSSNWAMAQTLPQPETQATPVEEVPTVMPTPAMESPATSTATATGAGSATVPEVEVSAPPVTTAPLPAAPLNVLYSRMGLNNSQTKEAMDGLRLVRQQATHNNIGQQVAINAALILLTGGLALNVRGFSKDDLSGIEPEDVVDRERLKNPALLHLPAEVQRRSAQWLAANEKTRGMSFKRPLVVNSAAWRLIYSTLDEADKTYKLKFDVDIYKDREEPSFFKGYKRAGKSCSFASEARPIENWKANDYQAVVDWIPQAVSQCASEFVAQLSHLLELE